jgi:hypothetical protein
MTAATVAMLAPLCSVLGGVDVHRVAVDGQVGIHADRPPTLLRDLAEEPGGAGEQGEATEQLDRQAEVGERSPTDTGAVERELPAEDLLVGAADRLEQPEVGAAQAFLVGDLDQARGTGILDLVDRVSQAGDEPAVLAGTSYGLERCLLYTLTLPTTERV